MLARVRKTLAQVRADALALRQDFGAWQNAFTGMGVSGKDRSVSTLFARGMALDAETCAALYHSDPMAGIVADAYPEEALRRGVQCIGADAAALEASFERVRLVDKVQLAAALGRAVGGACVVLGIDDGQAPDMPFRPRAGSTLDWIEVYDRRALEAVYIEGNPRSTLAGKASVFRVSPTDGRAPFLIHRSRCLMFGGVQTAERERNENNGWDWSVYDRVYNALRMFAEAHSSVGHMLTEASQSVFKLGGLLGMLASPNGQETLATRGLVLDMFRGLTRSILLDAGSGESYERHAASFAGVPETVDRVALLVSAVTRIPVTVLMGQAPAGLNATGAMDLRSWYDRVETYRTREILPAFQQTVRMLGAKCEVLFPPLWQPTETEQAALEKTQAETDAIYLDRDVYMPEDVARARFAGSRKPIVVDMSLREPVLGEQPASMLPEPVAGNPAVTLTPSDQVVIVSVNQGLAALGLPPMQGPDGELTIAEFKAKRAALLATIATAEAGGPEPAPAPAPAAPLAPETATVNEARAADGKGELRKDGERDPDGDLTIAAYRAKHSRVKLTPRDW